MQAVGYERLTKKAKNQETRQLLADISANEFKDSEYWSGKIEQLAARDKESGRSLSAIKWNGPALRGCFPRGTNLL
jgi:hypothetical protein